MSDQASFMLRGRNPDVLTCIANLSNDEVFTPPEFANRMLDTLAQAWAAGNGGANNLGGQDGEVSRPVLQDGRVSA
jgi:site-specific DNA-methyltransferase (adenine-specific)